MDGTLIKISAAAAAVIIVLLCAWRGTKRNAFKTLVSMLVMVVSAIGAFVFSKPAAYWIYDSYVKDEVVSSLSDGLGEYDLVNSVKDNISETYDIELSDDDIDRLSKCEDVAAEIKSIASDYGRQISLDEINEKLGESLTAENISEFSGGAVPDGVAQKLADSFRESNDNFKTVIRTVCEGDNEKTAEVLEQKVLRNQFIVLIRSIAALVIFIVLLVALKIIAAIMSAARILPVAKQLSSVAGFILGAAEGVIFVVILAAILSGIM